MESELRTKHSLAGRQHERWYPEHVDLGNRGLMLGADVSHRGVIVQRSIDDRRI